MRLSMLFILGVLSLTGCMDSEDVEQYLTYQATVDGQQIVSTDFPTGTVTFDSTLTYVGSDSFILYSVARCEIHLFAEADEQKKIQRLYWVQYEGYLPSMIPRSYDYSDEPYRTEIAGKSFYDGDNFYNVDEERPEWAPDSDIAHVFALLEKEGYQFDGDVMRIRLVHLDEQKKNELMIIYMEPMDTQGLSIEALGPGSKTTAAWTKTASALRERALAGMTLSFD